MRHGSGSDGARESYGRCIQVDELVETLHPDREGVDLDQGACHTPTGLSILSLMANQSAHLSDVFYALADPTRRAIVGLLGRGPASVSALAEPFAMALPSFIKHLAVLERSGVIRSTKLGRVRTCELKPKTLSRAEQWIARQRAIWEARTDRMSAFVEKIHQEDLSNGKPDRRPR
jgi:DNA-binding transcriptional ArsR family regulator